VRKFISAMHRIGYVVVILVCDLMQHTTLNWMQNDLQIGETMLMDMFVKRCDVRGVVIKTQGRDEVHSCIACLFFLSTIE